MSTSRGKDSVDHDQLATLGARFKFIACPQAEEKTVLIMISWQLWELDQIYSMSTSGGKDSVDRDQ